MVRQKVSTPLRTTIESLSRTTLSLFRLLWRRSVKNDGYGDGDAVAAADDDDDNDDDDDDDDDDDGEWRVGRTDGWTDG